MRKYYSSSTTVAVLVLCSYGNPYVRYGIDTRVYGYLVAVIFTNTTLTLILKPREKKKTGKECAVLQYAQRPFHLHLSTIEKKGAFLRPIIEISPLKFHKKNIFSMILLAIILCHSKIPDLNNG